MLDRVFLLGRWRSFGWRRAFVIHFAVVFWLSVYWWCCIPTPFRLTVIMKAAFLFIILLFKTLPAPRTISVVTLFVRGCLTLVSGIVWFWGVFIGLILTVLAIFIGSIVRLVLVSWWYKFLLRFMCERFNLLTRWVLSSSWWLRLCKVVFSTWDEI